MGHPICGGSTPTWSRCCGIRCPVPLPPANRRSDARKHAQPSAGDALCVFWCRQGVRVHHAMQPRCVNKQYAHTQSQLRPWACRSHSQHSYVMGLQASRLPGPVAQVGCAHHTMRLLTFPNPAPFSCCRTVPHNQRGQTPIMSGAHDLLTPVCAPCLATRLRSVLFVQAALRHAPCVAVGVMQRGTRAATTRAVRTSAVQGAAVPLAQEQPALNITPQVPSVATQRLNLIHFNDVYNVEERESEPRGGAARFVAKCRALQQVRRPSDAPDRTARCAPCKHLLRREPGAG